MLPCSGRWSSRFATLAPRKPGEFTITLGRHFVQGGGGADGTDLNLRCRRKDTSVRLGAYCDCDFGSQARAGAQTRWQPLSQVDVSLAPVLQVASRGLLGGRLTLEVGAPWFVQLGVGRTNLKPFVNLDFDSSDAVTAAIGWRDDRVGAYALTVVRDSRLGTGQQNVHLNGEWQWPGDKRLTLELLRKTGRGEGGELHAAGFTATLALTHWFIRLSYDPKQNVTDSDVTYQRVGDFEKCREIEACPAGAHRDTSWDLLPPQSATLSQGLSVLHMPANYRPTLESRRR